MKNPVVLHVMRPYDDVASYLEAEAWTIDTRGMLLLEQEALEPDVAVVFDVSLRDGSKLIRAEARVAEYLAASDDRPAGLRVRFRRFGAKTKAFIDHAVAEREKRLAFGRSLPRHSSRPPAGSHPPPSLRDMMTPSPAPASVTRSSRAQPTSSRDSSGLLRVGPGIAAPANREELLARLRERSPRPPESLPEPATKASRSKPA